MAEAYTHFRRLYPALKQIQTGTQANPNLKPGSKGS
jgi:hypothetical protein